MPSFNFTNLARHYANGAVKYDGSQNFRVMLVSSVLTQTDTTGNQDAWVNRSDVTNEITGTGYSAGGIAQPFTLNALTLVGNVQSITWTNISNGWTGATFTAAGAIIYLNSGAAATDRLIHFVDFLGNVSCTAGNFSINYSSNHTITA